MKRLPVDPINLKIAEKVMGLLPHGELQHLWRENHPSAPYIAVDYLSNIWSVWPVVDKMTELGFLFRLDLANTNGKIRARAKFYKSKDDGEFAESSGPAEAICRAALVALKISL